MLRMNKSQAWKRHRDLGWCEMGALGEVHGWYGLALPLTEQASRGDGRGKRGALIREHTKLKAQPRIFNLLRSLEPTGKGKSRG
jgi:hypothetical protein